ERHDRNHRVRAPEVDGAQEPAERGLEVQVQETLIRAVGRRYVDEREADARGDLQHEQGERRAAEDVPPARGAAWYRVIGNGRDGTAQPRSLLEPVERGTDGPGGVRSHTGLESVGSCPPSTHRTPSRI